MQFGQIGGPCQYFGSSIGFVLQGCAAESGPMAASRGVVRDGESDVWGGRGDGGDGLERFRWVEKDWFMVRGTM